MKRIRPSSLKNIEVCSDFEQPEDAPIHPLTEAGTRLHEAMETGSDKNLLEEDLPAFHDGQKMLADILPEEQPDTLLLEYSFRYPDGSYAGTVDRLQFHGNSVLMVDYKFGWNPVDHPSENAQFQDYVIKTFEEFPHIDTIDVYMLAPRLRVAQFHQYVRDDLPRLKARNEMIHARQGLGHRHATDMCRFCKLVGTCKVAYDHFAKPAPKLPVLKEDWAPTTPERVAEALDLLPVAESWFKIFRAQVKEAAKKMLSQGYEVGAYELKTRKGRSVVTDVAEVEKAAVELGVSKEDVQKVMTLQLGDVVKLVRDAAPEKKKGAWEEEFRSKAAEGITAGNEVVNVVKRK